MEVCSFFSFLSILSQVNDGTTRHGSYLISDGSVIDNFFPVPTFVGPFRHPLAAFSGDSGRDRVGRNDSRLRDQDLADRGHPTPDHVVQDVLRHLSEILISSFNVYIIFY
jgi:hypothetical protein